jgi:hypothetical protein
MPWQLMPPPLRLNLMSLTRRWLACFLALLGGFEAAPAASAQKYFPTDAFVENNRGANDFLDQWYSSALEKLGEPSLYERSGSAFQSYRFLWLRSFHHPVAVRLDLRQGGTAVLVVKVAGGTSGAISSRLLEEHSEAVTRKQVEAFLTKVDSVGYWDLIAKQAPTERAPDGSEWIVEGVKAGRYHVVQRWSPQDGPIRTLGLAFVLDLARLKLLPAEIY